MSPLCSAYGLTDIARAAVTVDVVDAGLRIIFLMKIADVDQTVLWLMVSTIAANRQVVIGFLASTVGGPPVWSQLIHMMLKCGHCTAATSLSKSCTHMSYAELVGDAKIELRVVLDEVVVHGWERGLCLNRVLIIQRRLFPFRKRCASWKNSVQLGSAGDPSGCLKVLFSTYSP